MKSLKNKNILVCVTGGIAAYKTCSLVNYLVKEGADVKVLMTRAATEFVAPLTFQALSGHAVYTDMFKIVNTEEVEHISLGKWAELVVISPATANTIGKISSGIADDLLSTVVMALPSQTKVLLAPAMNVNMWKNKITQKNIKNLSEQEDRYIFVSPRSGMLACRDEGVGKIADNKVIVEEIINVFSEK